MTEKEAKKEADHTNPEDQTVEVSKFTAKHIPIESIIAVYEKNPHIGARQVGELLGVTEGAIRARLKSSGYTPQRLKDYRRNEDKVQELLRSKITDVISTRDLSDEKTRDLVISYGVLFDKQHGQKVTVEGTLAVKALEAQESTLAEESQALMDKLEAQGIVIDLTPEASEDGTEPVYSVDGENDK